MRFHQKHNRKRIGSVPGNVGGWQIVYTGFILILLCFFILMTSFASLEQSKVTRFVKSFSNAVTVFSGGRSLEPGETVINSDAMMVDKENQIALLFEKVNLLSQKIGLENMDIRRSQKGVVITLADKLLFASGEAVLSASAYPLLEKITAVIKMVGVPTEIEGHTDDVPISTDKYPSNWELSTDRAVNVLRFMTESQHVDSNQLSAVGKSQYHPIVQNSSETHRKKNRRVEIIFKTE
jgi:chemotaxis protein MotB